MSWKKTRGKTATELERQHQEGFLIATEYKRMEGTGRGRDIWRRYIEETKAR
jgi:hypothetical protein